MKIKRENLYKRQTTLSEIGFNGQNKLQQSKVLIVGCGGLGGNVAVNLAASGVGTIHLIDFDLVDLSNLHRQTYYRLEDIGQSKAETLANYIQKITPFVTTSFSKEAILKSNAKSLVSKFDIIVDCTDSLPTKYLLNDICVILKKPLVYGSLYKFDGYVASFNVLNNEKYSCNLRDAFPEISKQKVPNCSEVGTLNTIVGIIAMLQANEVIKLITGTGNILTNQLLIYNSQNNSQLKVKLKSKYNSSEEQIKCFKEIFKLENYFDPGCEIQDPNLLISQSQLRDLKNIDNYEIISVIGDDSIIIPFEINQQIPLSKLKPEQIRFDLNKTYITVCLKGISSYQAASKIKQFNSKIKVLSLTGGIEKYQK